MKNFIRQLRLTNNAFEKVALEQDNDVALEHIDKRENLSMTLKKVSKSYPN